MIEIKQIESNLRDLNSFKDAHLLIDNIKDKFLEVRFICCLNNKEQYYLTQTNLISMN